MTSLLELIIGFLTSLYVFFGGPDGFIETILGILRDFFG